MKTLIATHRAQDLAFARGEYLPPETLAPGDVAAAEQRHILPVVGRALYEKMLDGAYGEFVAEYLEVPVRVEYEIAPRCRSLIPILDDLGRWCDSLPAVSGGVTNGGPGPADTGGAAL